MYSLMRPILNLAIVCAALQWSLASGVAAPLPARDARGAAESRIPARSSAAPAPRLATGDWGIVELTPLVLRVPLEATAPEAVRCEPMRWFFPQGDEIRARQRLREAGCRLAGAAPLVFEPASDGVWFLPSPDWIVSLSSESRSEVYRFLARSERNPRQRYPFTFARGSLDAQLAAAGLEPATATLIRRLVCPLGEILILADAELVLERCGTLAEKRRFLRFLTTHAALGMRLTLPQDMDLGAVVGYWGAQGRESFVRPLLEALRDSRGTGYLDVAYLLPPLGRNLLMTYPTDASDNRPNAPHWNCFWTSLNFFAARPDARLVDANIARDELARSYVRVTGEKRFGDVVVWRDEAGGLTHMAVWIAADVVFTKNGYDALHPWTLMSLGELGLRFPFARPNDIACYRRR